MIGEESVSLTSALHKLEKCVSRPNKKKPLISSTIRCVAAVISEGPNSVTPLHTELMSSSRHHATDHSPGSATESLFLGFS